MSATFKFVNRTVQGDPCVTCSQKTPVEKILIYRADHPDGVHGGVTSLTRHDLVSLVNDASEYLGLEVRRRWA